MGRFSSIRRAQGSIAVLFLVLLRTLGEDYRLRAVPGPAPGLRAFEPYITGLLLGVGGMGVAVALCLAGRPRAVIGTAVLTMAALFVYKVAVIR